MIEQTLEEIFKKLFENNIINVKSKKELKEVIDAGKIARCGFCSIDIKGEKCAEVVEKETKTAWGWGSRKDVVISWKKAYASSRN